MCLQKSGAVWGLRVPLQRDGLPLPCIAKSFCLCDIWATAAVIRRGLLFLEIINKVSMLFIKIWSVHCEFVTVIQEISADIPDNLLKIPFSPYSSEGWEFWLKFQTFWLNMQFKKLRFKKLFCFVFRIHDNLYPIINIISSNWGKLFYFSSSYTSFDKMAAIVKIHES